MITLVTGDILKDDSEALVNTVNCVGVMGRGIALQFKHTWPENFKAYAAACKREEVQIGQMFLFDTQRLTLPRYIINFPTKRHWRDRSRMEDIEAGLDALATEICVREIRSIAIPPLGSGLGGLDWNEVRPRIEAALGSLDNVRIRLYVPNSALPSATVPPSRTVPTMTAGRAALVELMRRYLGGMLDPTITLLEVHKLIYFMQEAGEPLRLHYVQAPYGPYAENLRHVLNAIEGHMIVGYTGGGDVPGTALTLVPGIVEAAATCLRSHAETWARFERVDKLVEGFESPFGLELLSTVHWVMTREVPDALLAEIVEHTYGWNEQKRKFTPRQIAIAAQRLAGQGWATMRSAES